MCLILTTTGSQPVQEDLKGRDEASKQFRVPWRPWHTAAAQGGRPWWLVMKSADENCWKKMTAMVDYSSNFLPILQGRTYSRPK